MRYSDNGKSLPRVKNLTLKKKCECPRLICFQKFQKLENDVVTFARTFWEMAKPEQDAYEPASETIMQKSIVIIVLFPIPQHESILCRAC